ncbi:MAG: type II secretion system protein [Cyanobacteria bacterium P01_A01_bin.83]
MKNKEFHKLLKKNKSNSGFTLTELLVGLIMSVFVIGALGFGLMQVLQLTQKGNSETAARNESSRALDFISEEMRRAQAIEVDMSDIDTLVGSDYTSKKISGAVERLVLQIPGVDQRVIYSVAEPEDSSPWKGPRAIYRWGPAFNAAGDYSNPDNPAVWQNEVLVDGISNVSQSVKCDNNNDGIEETISYEGFFACVVDDDGDVILNAAGNPVLDGSGNPIKENVVDTNGDGEITFADDPLDLNGDGEYNFGERLADTNGDGAITIADSALDRNRDGVINAEDGADTDGLAITAQLYFTGETKGTTKYNASSYSADTKTVARARTAPDNNAKASGSSFTAHNQIDTQFACTDTVIWKMRTDFGDSISNPSNLDKWEYDPNNSSAAQPQPIDIEGDTLTISSVPMGVGNVDCLNSRANNGREDDQLDPRDFEGNKNLADEDWYGDSTKDDVVAVSHVINLNDPRTFNGDHVDCTGSICAGGTEGKVYTKQDGEAAKVNPYVLVLKQGTELPALNGYDMNDNGDLTDDGDQISLGELLVSEGYATFNGSVYRIDNLDSDQRIIAFEVGKSDVSNKTAPGVDFQDNIFILQSDAFAQKYKTYEDNFNNSDSYTPPTYNVPY